MLPDLGRTKRDVNIANAEDFISNPKFYVGVGVGKSSVDTGVTATTGTARLDEDDTGYKIFGGVQVNNIVGVEAFYVDFGEVSLTGNNGDTFAHQGTTYTFTANNVKVTAAAKTFGIAPTLGYDVTEQFRPYVKAGFHRWDADASVTASSGSAALSDSGTDLMYGLGAVYMITDNVGIGAEYERFKFDSEDVDFLSANLRYKF